MNDFGRATEFARRARALTWYHTFDLAPGIATHALFDHRRITNQLLIPERLDGLRCLDAASADGFFAYELKRRGAAEVVSLDGESMGARDWQGAPGYRPEDFDMSELRQRFDLVGEATGLEVKRVQMNLYDLNPAALGSFDLVFMGNVLLHLRNPQAALHAIHSVTRGEFISFEMISLLDSILHPWSATARLWDGRPTSRWWLHNIAGHRHLLRVSGFQPVETRAPVFQAFGSATPRRPKELPRNFTDLTYWLWTRWAGLPSSVVRARPVKGPPPA